MRGSEVFVHNRGVNIGVKAGVNGAGMADFFDAFAKFGGDFGCRERDGDGQAADAARGGWNCHVLLDGGGSAGDVDAAALEEHCDGGEDAGGQARGDQVGR